MMDKESKKELIEGIRDLFNEYEEPYAPEEWEDFQKYRNKHPKQILRLSKWIGAAAALILVYYGIQFLMPVPQFETTPEVVKELKKPNTENSSAEPLIREEYRQIDQIPNIERKASLEHPLKGGQLPKQEVFSDKWDSNLLSADSLLPPNDLAIVEQLEEEVQKDKESPVIKPESNTWLPEQAKVTVSNENKKPTAEPTERWNIGLELSPALTNKAMTFGGGISIQYHLSEKISFTSGVGYLDLEGGRDLAPSSAEGKHLQSVNTSINALSIPLVANFHINKQLYTSIGITSLSVFDENRTAIFLVNQWVDGIGSDGTSGKVWQSEEQEEHNSKTPFQGKSYIGFLDVSVGYKPPFFKQFDGAFVPYLRIPVGALSTEDVKLLHGGITLRFLIK